MNTWLAKFKKLLGAIRDFLDEKALATAHLAPLSRLQRFAHFWLMVAKSFTRNRCPVHAAGLAYTTLLALIPMLFVVVSVSNSILKDEGTRRLNRFIDTLLVSMTPPSSAGTNSAVATATSTNANAASSTMVAGATNTFSETNLTSTANESTNAIDARASAQRDQLVQSIDGFIKNIQGGTLGVTGALVLVAIAIAMLRSIESTFNDIWGVARGRHWMAQIMQYAALLFLGPLALGVALSLVSNRHMQAVKQLLHTMPAVSHLLFESVPIALLCLAFAVFYLLMPNTRVHWGAALMGGILSGILWHLNNYFSVLYVSRWVTNSKIYGSLAAIPVFMAGLYFSWLIVLFGAQVAHAYQNRDVYLQEKLAENVNQRGREFIALRLMECIGQRFQLGEPPACVPELAECLSVPTRLVQQLTQTLLAARLIVEVTGLEPAYAPARPLETITCHDILLALRAGQGQDLATRDDAARAGVFGEFERILQAEKAAASSVTVLAMVNRTESLAALSAQPVKAVTDGKQG
jgi:membrane protein